MDTPNRSRGKQILTDEEIQLEKKNRDYWRTQGIQDIFFYVSRVVIVLVVFYDIAGVIIITFFKSYESFFNPSVWEKVAIYSAGILTAYIKDILGVSNQEQ